VLGPSDDIDNETLAAFCNLPGPLDADSTAARLYDARVATHTASPHQPPQ
jgi:hypothetical protein